MTELKIRPTWLNSLGQLQSRIFTPASTQQRRVFQAKISESMLLSRLKAKNRRDASAVVLERAALMSQITCQNWFGSSEKSTPEPVLNALQLNAPKNAQKNASKPGR
jgi:hypothetical protein